MLTGLGYNRTTCTSIQIEILIVYQNVKYTLKLNLLRDNLKYYKFYLSIIYPLKYSSYVKLDSRTQLAAIFYGIRDYYKYQ